MLQKMTSALRVSLLLLFSAPAIAPSFIPDPAFAAAPASETQGISVVTQSSLGTSVRSTVVQSAKLVEAEGGDARDEQQAHLAHPDDALPEADDPFQRHRPHGLAPTANEELDAAVLLPWMQPAALPLTAGRSTVEGAHLADNLEEHACLHEHGRGCGAESDDGDPSAQDARERVGR